MYVTNLAWFKFVKMVAFHKAYRWQACGCRALKKSLNFCSQISRNTFVCNCYSTECNILMDFLKIGYLNFNHYIWISGIFPRYWKTELPYFKTPLIRLTDITMYILNFDKQTYHFCRLRFLIEKFGGLTIY